MTTEPDTLYSEVKEAIDHLGSGKAPDIDNITAEFNSESGEDSKNAVHRLCNQIWKQRT